MAINDKMVLSETELIDFTADETFGEEKISPTVTATVDNSVIYDQFTATDTINDRY